MKPSIRIPRIALATAALLAASGSSAAKHAKHATIPLEASTMIIEFNSSAEDLGVQFFLDSEGWTSIEILDPRGREIFGAEAEGRLARQGGGTELFLESVEPPLSELSFDKFFDRFPEGTYRFRGRNADGDPVVGTAEFSHDVPAGPEVVSPVGPGGTCATNVSIPAVITWKPVTKSVFGKPLQIARYEVIVENDDVNFDVHMPASAGTSLTISPEILQPGTDYNFEVLAVEAGGNQTITEGCFSTAP